MHKQAHTISIFGTNVLLLLSAVLELSALIGVTYLILELAEPSLSNALLHLIFQSIIIGSPEILMFIGAYKGYHARDTRLGKCLMVITGCMLLVTFITVADVQGVISLSGMGIRIMNTARFILVICFNVCVHIPHLVHLATSDVQACTLPDTHVQEGVQEGVQVCTLPGTHVQEGVQEGVQASTHVQEDATPQYIEWHTVIERYGYNPRYLQRRVKEGKILTHPEHTQLIYVDSLPRNK